MCVLQFSKKEKKYQKILTVADYEWWITSYFYCMLLLYSSLKFSRKLN